MLRQFPVIRWPIVALTLLTLAVLAPAAAYDIAAIDLGSGLIDYIQKMIVAAMQIAEKKV